MKEIIINGLYKSYGENHVLRGFNATISLGKITCIMGPSGYGKTTLLNILMGLEKADSGQITGLPNIKSAVFQEDRLCEDFNAIANIRFICKNNACLEDTQAHLTAVGLTDEDISRPVRELSGGMKRRVAIVRAVLARADIIFLDEPFKGLDTETKLLVINYLKKETTDKTVIMVTHSLEEVKAMGGSLLDMTNYNTDEKAINKRNEIK
mgnify:CR=1 FL=1